MMNKKEALQWLVDNVKEWPETIPCQFKGMIIDEWKFIPVDMQVKFFNIPGIHDCLTEQNWQAAQPSPASNDDGWIVHKGREIPVDDDVKVEVAFADEETAIDCAGRFEWGNEFLNGNIVKYRVISAEPASNKPSWDDAPEGAKILAQDENGAWAFCSSKNVHPSDKDGKWMVPWDKYRNGMWSDPISDEPNPNWRETLEHRPTVKDSLTTELDPSGLSANSPGAKLDAGKVRPDLILNAMPNALLAVAEVATFGAAKYSENGWLSVPDGVKRYTSAMDRHRLKEGIELLDTDSELRHAAHLAWNALARLELMLRN
jgi:hypothetical protein